jgi:hypothetical protein
MPLTAFQSQVLRWLAPNRSPDSYVAGGIALNARSAVRWSADVDLFHDVEQAVIRASDADVETLQQAGCSIRQEIWTPSFRRAWVERGEDGVKLEWCQDSAWRFFPIEPDELLGWRLHCFDALTNKALAMGGRAETRDLVDIVSNAGKFPLHTMIWAACAKDPGYNPLLLLNQMRRNSRVDPAELKEMGTHLEPVELKTRWLALSELAGNEIERAATAQIGHGLTFLNEAGEIGWFDQPGFKPHQATLGGSLPRLVGFHYEP